MRILFVVEHFPALSETFVLNQVTGLLDRGHDVEIFPLGLPTSGPIHPDVERYGLLARTWVKPAIPVSWAPRLVSAARVIAESEREARGRLLRTVNPFLYGRDGANLKLLITGSALVGKPSAFDVVHCHFGSNGVNASTWRESGLLKAPLTVVFHAHEIAGLSDKQGKRYYRRLFASNALLLPVSDFWRRKLISWGAAPDRIVVHRMGVDCSAIKFRPREILPDRPVELLTVCRFVEQKGLEYAMRAFSELHAKHPLSRFTLVGDGPLRSDLEQLVSQLGVRHAVEFVGPQPQERVQEFLARAHVFVAPSVTARDGLMEGIPVALMEAMAAGLPVVSTRHSGIPELIEHDVSGILADERDAQGILQGIDRLIREPNFTQRIIRQARGVVESRYNIRSLVGELERIFERERLAQ